MRALQQQGMELEKSLCLMSELLRRLDIYYTALKAENRLAFAEITPNNIRI
jgi:hypothetical protein